MLPQSINATPQNPIAISTSVILPITSSNRNIQMNPVMDFMPIHESKIQNINIACELILINGMLHASPPTMRPINDDINRIFSVFCIILYAVNFILLLIQDGAIKKMAHKTDMTVGRIVVDTGSLHEKIKRNVFSIIFVYV